MICDCSKTQKKSLFVAISGLVQNNWRKLTLSLGYISCIWGLHFRIYKTYPCLLAAFCLFGWEVAVWILVEIFMRDYISTSTMYCRNIQISMTACLVNMYVVFKVY